MKIKHYSVFSVFLFNVPSKVPFIREYHVISIHAFQKYRMSAMSMKIVASITILQMVLHATNAGKGRFRRLIVEEMIKIFSQSLWRCLVPRLRSRRAAVLHWLGLTKKQPVGTKSQLLPNFFLEASLTVSEKRLLQLAEHRIQETLYFKWLQLISGKACRKTYFTQKIYITYILLAYNIT